MPNNSITDMLYLEITPMKSREIHKFFEPLVLLKALGSATRKTAVSPSLEASIDIEDDEEIFKAFVYKLGHVCDNVKGDCGATITSFCVLQDQAEEDLVHYWFASNQRTHGELETTKIYVKGLLEKANEASEDIGKEKEVFATLLSNVLSFNRPRVTYYIKQIIAQASKCISICLSSVDEKSELETLRLTSEFMRFNTDVKRPGDCRDSQGVGQFG